MHNQCVYNALLLVQGVTRRLIGLTFSYAFSHLELPPFFDVVMEKIAFRNRVLEYIVLLRLCRLKVWLHVRIVFFCFSEASFVIPFRKCWLQTMLSTFTIVISEMQSSFATIPLLYLSLENFIKFSAFFVKNNKICLIKNVCWPVRLLETKIISASVKTNLFFFFFVVPERTYLNGLKKLLGLL